MSSRLVARLSWFQLPIVSLERFCLRVKLYFPYFRLCDTVENIINTNQPLKSFINRDDYFFSLIFTYIHYHILKVCIIRLIKIDKRIYYASQSTPKGTATLPTPVKHSISGVVPWSQGKSASINLRHVSSSADYSKARATYQGIFNFPFAYRQSKYAARIHHCDNADAPRHQRDRAGDAASQSPQIIYQNNSLYCAE